MTLRRRKPLPEGLTSIAPAISECLHPAVLNNMCVVCGHRVKTLEDDHTIGGNDSAGTIAGTAGNLTMTGGRQLRFLSEKAMLEKQKEKELGLQRVRKLALILDLDHTLIHTIAIDSPRSKTWLMQEKVHHLRIEEKLENGNIIPKHYLVKKRPHLDDFLQSASENFQMTIYTAGTRKYAEAIAKLIDPTGRLFSGRMVSRTDVSNDKSSGLDKSLSRIFLGDPSMALIVDDREDVWKGEQSRQLYLVRPFEHFRGAREVNNTAGNSSSDSRIISMREACSTSAEEDDQLLRCLQVITNIHTDYYNSYDKLIFTSPAKEKDSTSLSETVQQQEKEKEKEKEKEEMEKAKEARAKDTNLYGNALPEVDISDAAITTAVSTDLALLPVSLFSAGDALVSYRQEVLAGCVISFSGLIPLNERNPAEKCLLWRIALLLGAQVSVDVSNRTTHLVASNAESKKVEECHTRGDVWIVHADWLMYSRWAMSKASEVTFMLCAPVEGRNMPEPILDTTPLPVEHTLPLVFASSSCSVSESMRDNTCTGTGMKRSRGNRESYLDQATKSSQSLEDDEDMAKSIRKMKKMEADVAAAEQAVSDNEAETAKEEQEQEHLVSGTVSMLGLKAMYSKLDSNGRGSGSESEAESVNFDDMI